MPVRQHGCIGSFEDILRDAWFLAGGAHPTPTTADEFTQRFSRVRDLVLADSYFDEMESARVRFQEVADAFALADVGHATDFGSDQLQALSRLNRVATNASMCLNAALLLDRIEGRERYLPSASDDAGADLG